MLDHQQHGRGAADWTGIDGWPFRLSDPPVPPIKPPEEPDPDDPPPLRDPPQPIPIPRDPPPPPLRA